MVSAPQPVVHIPSWVDPRFVPELYLFFSVDIEGSTSFKNSVGGGRSTWGPFFLEFFQTFPSNLAKCEADFWHLFDASKSTPFVLWKSLGDELIFTKKLDNGFDAFLAVCAAKEAIIQGSSKLRSHRENRADAGEKNHYPTHLKGTAWLAGFPIKNMKISRTNVQDDYIGPSIDLGFRLTKLSSPWHMAVSAPLSWMVAKIQHEQSSILKGQTLKWFYRGREALKGIHGGKSGYPVFCIDVADSAEGVSKEELNLLDRGDVKPRDVIDFCETLYEKTGSQPGRHGRPFILGDNEYGLDMPVVDSDGWNEYIRDYKAFLTTQPMVSEPSISNGTDDAEQVLIAIDQAATAVK